MGRRRRGRRRSRATGLVVLALAWASAPAWADEPEPGEAETVNLAEIPVSEELQAFVRSSIEELLAADARLRKQQVRVAVVDLPPGQAASLGHWNGDSPVYPASVVKFVYLMAAYEWRDQGLLEIDPGLSRQLDAMVYASSNRATQQVLRRLTETEAGPRLPPEEYAAFVERRHRVKRWLVELGVDDLHAVHPTYDGGGDLYGRDAQFLQDPDIAGSLPNQTGEYRNRQAMTANGTAELLALLATDRALEPASCAEVRERMRRSVERQRYLVHRIAGGTDSRTDLEVFGKTGTWGPIYSDAGIVRHASGHQIVVVAFLEGSPRYRGSFIAKLTRRAVRELLPPEKPKGRSAGAAASGAGG